VAQAMLDGYRQAGIAAVAHPAEVDRSGARVVTASAAGAR